MRSLLIPVVVFSALLLLGGWFYGDPHVFFSLAMGVVLGLVNFLLWIWIIRDLLSETRIRKRRLLLALLGKGLVLLVIIGLILKKGHVSPIPLLLGISNVVAGLFGYALQGLWRGDDTHA